MTSQLWVALENSVWIYQDVHIKPVKTYSENPFISKEIETTDKRIEELPSDGDSQIRNQQEDIFVDNGDYEDLEVQVYHIIVGSFTSEEPAQRRMDILKGFGYNDCEILQSSTGQYRLSCGQYLNREEAEADLELIQAKLDPKAWILKN